jgi:hypothetical protein
LKAPNPARISHTPPADVAQALVPAVSRLVSTPVRGRDTVSNASVGMSADAAGTSACATSKHPNTGERSGLVGQALTPAKPAEMAARLKENKH